MTCDYGLELLQEDGEWVCPLIDDSKHKGEPCRDCTGEPINANAVGESMRDFLKER